MKMLTYNNVIFVYEVSRQERIYKINMKYLVVTLLRKCGCLRRAA